MTTPTVTEAEEIGKGWYAYRRVIAAEWPAGRSMLIAPALEGLAWCLETYRDLLAKPQRAHPAAAFPELEGDPEDMDKALKMAARDAADWAAELDRLVPVAAEKTSRDETRSQSHEVREFALYERAARKMGGL